MRILALLFALATVCACGSTPKNQNPDGGSPDPIEFFNLVVGRCWEFSATTSAATPPNLGLAIEKQDDGRRFGVAVYQVVYRQSGFPSVTEYWAVSGTDLVMYGREYRVGKMYEYNPPVVLLRTDLHANEEIATSTTTSERTCDTTGCTNPTSSGTQFKLNAGEDSPTTPYGQLTGFRLTYIETPATRNDSRVFQPKLGFGLLDINVESNPINPGTSRYRLQAVKDLADPRTCGT